MPKTEVTLKPSVETLEERLDGMAEAVKLLQNTVNNMPTPAIVQSGVDALKELTDTKITGLRELIDAKFEGNKTALDAALKTQKEGADKIDSNFTKQFENVVANIQTLTKSFDDKITDVKDRFNTSQGHGSGVKDGFGYIVGGVGLLVGVLAVIGFVLSKG